jgi:hypothetical protein
MFEFRNVVKVFAGMLLVVGCAGAPDKDSGAKSSDAADGFKKDFNVKTENFSSTGRNDYFVLEPNFQQVFKGEDEGKPAELIITVLDETKSVDGVETRIVEERESSGGKLVEVSRNYFAVDKRTSDVYYFGEEVDMYGKDGAIKNHEGSWESGKDGAHYGMFMPAKPKVGQKFYQEIAPGKAMDRFEIVSLSDKKKVPAGEFDHVLKSKETTPLEPNTTEYKYYAPGAGLLIDGDVKLTKYGPKEK